MTTVLYTLGVALILLVCQALLKLDAASTLIPLVVFSTVTLVDEIKRKKS